MMVELQPLLDIVREHSEKRPFGWCGAAEQVISRNFLGVRFAWKVEACGCRHCIAFHCEGIPRFTLTPESVQSVDVRGVHVVLNSFFLKGELEEAELSSLKHDILAHLDKVAPKPVYPDQMLREQGWTANDAAPAFETVTPDDTAAIRAIVDGPAGDGVTAELEGNA